jgi:hypothetical protein
MREYRQYEVYPVSLLSNFSMFRTATFARGTPLVRTKGSKDVSCIGLVSSSGNATQIEAIQQAVERAQEAQHHNTIIVAICVALVFVLLFGGGIAAYVRIRRRRDLASIQFLTPRKFEEYSQSTISGPLHLNTGLTVQTSSLSPTVQMSLTNGTSSPDSVVRHDFACPPDCDCRRRTLSSERHYPSQFPSKRRPSDSNNSPPTGEHRKPPVTSNRSVRAVVDIRRPTTAIPDLQPTRDRSMSTLPPLPSDADAQSEIIIQHRDGGRAIVREIPPPYHSRSSQSSDP